MALYLLDGNILTALEDRTRPYFQVVRQRLTALDAADRVAISVVSAYEYQHGIAKAQGDLQDALRRTWTTFLEVFEILPLSLNGAQLYGELRARYEREVGASAKAVSRHTSDFLLAATALETAAILVSGDHLFTTLRKLEPQLQVENWRSADG
ncbi:MAG: type II toxin-antitoxin system VapC family toxin [Acidobacteriota bacterium]|nr:type II toxin-antitoxin system VapC family toxin [Acidobacteriota bacterium]